MSNYEHKTDIEHLLRENPFLTDETFAPIFREFLEVYRKADAFDEIRGYSEDQLAYDLDDGYVLSNVQYAIQKTVDETEGY